MYRSGGNSMAIKTVGKPLTDKDQNFKTYISDIVLGLDLQLKADTLSKEQYFHYELLSKLLSSYNSQLTLGNMDMTFEQYIRDQIEEYEVGCLSHELTPAQLSCYRILWLTLCQWEKNNLNHRIDSKIAAPPSHATFCAHCG
jgi:hypothetical protein